MGHPAPRTVKMRGWGPARAARVRVEGRAARTPPCDSSGWAGGPRVMLGAPACPSCSSRHGASAARGGPRHTTCPRTAVVSAAPAGEPYRGGGGVMVWVGCSLSQSKDRAVQFDSRLMPPKSSMKPSITLKSFELVTMDEFHSKKCLNNIFTQCSSWNIMPHFCRILVEYKNHEYSYYHSLKFRTARLFVRVLSSPQLYTTFPLGGVHCL